MDLFYGRMSGNSARSLFALYAGRRFKPSFESGNRSYGNGWPWSGRSGRQRATTYHQLCGWSESGNHSMHHGNSDG
jgi:hypothetical protein